MLLKRELDLRSMVQNVLLAGDGSADACRLCFGLASAGQLFLAEEVEMERRPYCADTVRLADMLAALTGAPVEDETGLPEGVCLACAAAAIDAYIFLQFCRYSASAWRDLRRTLTRAAVSLAPDTDTKSLFVFVEGGRTSVAADARPAPPVGEPRRLLRRARSLHARERRRALRGRARTFQCEGCGKTFATAAALSRHTATHDRTLACVHCTKAFPSRSVLNMHVTRVHGDKRLPCPLCTKLFPSRPLLTAHTKEIHTYADCKHCGKTYSRHSLRKHERSHGPRVPCDTCSGTFRSAEILRAHAARCPGAAAARPPPRVACALCPNTYSCRGTLQQHMRYAHGDDPLRCTHCGKKYMDKNKLRWHTAEHTGQKSFQCGVCGAYFKQASTLAYHMRARHTFERPHPCDLCPHAFITSFRLTEHKRRHHGAPAPHCAACRVRFTTRARLHKHLRKYHAPDEPAPPAESTH